jgi:arylsulfatase A-like enzyme
MEEMQPAGDGRRGAATSAVALLLSLLAVAAVEATVAMRSPEIGATGGPAVTALAMWSAWKYLSLPMGYAALASALALIPTRRAWRYVRGASHVVAAGATVVAMYLVLASYEPFRGYPPFVAGYAIGGVLLVSNALAGGRLPDAWRLPVSAALVAAGGALHFVNYQLYFGLYSTLHLAIIQAELLVFWIAAGGVLRLVPDRPLRIAGAAALAAVGALGVAGALAARRADDVGHVFVDTTVLGQSVTVFNDFSEGRQAHQIVDANGPRRFREASGMPELPRGFELERYNILLIASEATRFDKTTMSDPETPSTPNLARRSRAGLLFENAYAPSSGTLHSLAGLFTMAYPSMIAMETWMQVWTGELYEEEETVAESLGEAGYDTFWVGYNHWFPENLLGYEQGFSSVELVPGNDDEKIAGRAVTAIEKRSGASRPFFGFLFFVSPHGPYLDHGYTDLPNRREADRYLQEVRFVDTQVERVFEALERTGELERTIVIYLSDHGEEFREHGGRRHKTTVYCESTHVPLVVWIPGVPPAALERPVSTAYVFPWLFSNARSPSLRARFEQRAIHAFGPMLRETDGAVVVELIGNDRMKSALVYDDLKINLDLISSRIEAYRLRSDPGERKNLFASDPAVRAEATRLVDSYRRVRQAEARYVLKPKRRAGQPREED